MSLILHERARCRWCGGPFKQIFGWQWICATDVCADRCIAHAVLAPEPVDGTSPYLFLPLPLQVDIEESPIKRLLVWGPAGIAKSFGGRWHLYKRCLAIPGYQCLLLRVTYDQLFRNHLQFMGAETKSLGKTPDGDPVAKYFAGTDKPKHVQFQNGSTLWAGYCQHEVDIAQHMGTEYDEIVPEEAVHFLPRALAEIVTRDRGSAPARPAMASRGFFTGRSRLLTNTGGQAMEFLRDHYVDRTPDLDLYPEYDPAFYGAITGEVTDNPYLSPNYLKETLGGLEKARYDQLARGSWDAFPGQFFPDFDPSRHVR